jgi:high-affinity K+ transport system ATPase subunit B
MQAAADKSLKLTRAKKFTAVAGHGVSAMLKEKAVLFGNAALMQEQGVAYDDFTARMQYLAEQGQTPMLLAVDKKVAGIIAVADPIKKDSSEAISALKKQGVRIFAMPNKTAFSLSIAETPCPATAVNFFARVSFNDLSAAACIIASANGCSEPFSMLAANCKTSSCV